VHVIRLLIADDHTGVRLALVDLFGSTTDISVVAACTDGDEVLPAARSTSPDVALLDHVMPRMTGLEAAKQLRAECPGVKIVLLTGTVLSSVMAEAKALGAAGFLAKGEDSDSLPDHIRTVAVGGSLWPELRGLPRAASPSSTW
jgi:DNA-binding NarL/FixJ family response regulator